MTTTLEGNYQEYAFSSFKNEEKCRRYAAWMNYYTGVSGTGTTLIDKLPDFEKPTDIPISVRMFILLEFRNEALFRQECWNESMIEMGEYESLIPYHIPETLEHAYNLLKEEGESYRADIDELDGGYNNIPKWNFVQKIKNLDEKISIYKKMRYDPQ